MQYEHLKVFKQSEKSSVFLVYDEERKKLAVEKQLKGEIHAYEQLTKLSHPFLPKIYEVKISDGMTYVLEEYIDGKCLVEINASENQVGIWFNQLCKVVQFLHSKNILHRDIKPSNILLGRDGNIRLIDFDAARSSKSPSATDKDTRLLGTRGYAPPEQYGFSQTDRRSDIYSLGITLKHLLGENSKKPKWRGILKRCTQLEPKRRFSTITALQTALLFRKLRHILLYPALIIFALIIMFYISILVYEYYFVTEAS